MEIYTVQEFQKRWEEMIERVENGEQIGVINETGQTAIMIPVDDKFVKIHTEMNNEAP